MEWDVALTQNKGSLLLRFPDALARPVTERGMFRAKVTLTAEGVLVRPYVAASSRGRTAVDLPEGWGA